VPPDQSACATAPVVNHNDLDNDNNHKVRLVDPQVYNLMERDNFSRFKNTDAFRQALSGMDLYYDIFSKNSPDKVSVSDIMTQGPQ
jgi:hypothetical protein